MADSATIIAASLDSSQLEQSINKLVATVASKTKEMADNFTGEIKRMEDAVKNLGNIKINSGSASDGGSSRRTSTLKKEEEQGKAVAMGYDAIAASNKRASDSAVAFLDNERQAYRARQREIEYEIKALQRRFNSVEIKPIVKDDGTFNRAVDNIKQKIQEARQKLQEVPPTSMLGRKFSQELQNLRAEMNGLIQSRKAFEAQGKISNLQAEYAKISDSLISLGLAYRRASTEEKIINAEMEKGANSIQKYGDSADKAYQKMLKLSFDRAMSIPTKDTDLATAKLERLQAILADSRFLGALSPSQIKRARTEVEGLQQSLGAIATKQDATTQSAHQYTEEIRKQAQAIRESQQWKEKGYAMIGDRVYYDPERSVAPAKNRLSLEEQILNVQKEEEVAAIRAASAQRQEAAEKAATEQEARKMLATEQQITAEQQKRSQPKTFASYDSLQESIAHVLGLQKQQVRLVDEETASYRNLDSALKQYRQAYNALTDSERKSDNGKMLIRRMQEISREIQKIQALSARPISLDSIIGKSVGGARIGGLSEKTLDDIAYKMQRLASLRSGLNVETQQTEIRTVNAEYDRLKKKMDEVMQKNQQMIGSNNALGRSWNYMKNRLAFYFTVGASTQFIKNLIEVRSQYEMNERALGILINSAERGTQIFNELSQMALVSPYTLIELSAAAKQLTAYDIAARDVVDTTRRLADMASAVGVPIERLTYALGQIKAYGYLNSRDARMFANAGIPLVKQLSDYYTELEGKMVSTADVYDRMKKKAIDYNSVMSVITKMTDEGGKFFDFQAKMADTLKVRLANLTLAWNNMLNDMGKESQGVLTWGIGALRQLFLHWKQLDSLIKDAAWILGIRTGFMLIAYAALKAGGALGITTRQMALSSVVGTKLAGVLGTLGRSIATIAKSPLTWWTLLALAAWNIFDAFVNADKATIEFNNSLRDSAKTTYEDLKKFAEQYKNVRDSLYKTEDVGKLGSKETTITTPQNIEEGEAKKVWEAMREQIELSSHASDEYISKLLSIENVSERLRQGFQILDDIQTVSAALKEIGEDGIKVTQSWAAWWNAWQGADGLIGNVKDLQKEIQKLQDAGQDPNDKFTKVIDKDYATALERFRKDLKVTTDSVIDFINLNGWSGDTGKIDEVFKQVTDRLATQSNLDPQTAFTLQREVEVARAKAAKEALEIRIADEKKALATASDEISKQQIQKNLETLEQQKRDFDKFNGENRAYWNDFTKYIKERHISELTAAYNSMTDHGKKAMDFQSEEWQKRVHDWANRYEKSHNLATDSVFNRLRNWINDANTWSVFIKMTISTEDGKSVYKQLEEYDKAADDAWKTMQRLDKRISQLRKKGAKEVEGAETGVIDLSRVSQDDRELTEALKERTQAQKDYNDAVEKGGESKKENAAASKAQKAAESELAKALKDELKLIETVRSSYKDLTKEGASHTDAIEKSVSGYEKSVANINKVLEKYGVKLDLTKFAGIANPHELQEMFKQQLNALAGKAKPTEIQALEVELQKVDLDVEKYDLTKITKGLNNELDRLKDEYELAVSLDADPELGNMFADWMGIDVSDLPRTASEYAERASKILNNKLKDLGAKTELPSVLDITDDDMRAFEENKVFTDKQLELVKKAVDAARGFQKKETEERIKDWDKLLEKYAEYETKVNKIQNDAVKERVTFAQQFGNDEEKSLALNLQTQILAATDPQEKQKLINQLQELIMSIAGNDRTKVNLAVAIDTKNKQDLETKSFEEFQKSPEWIVATGDLANMSKSAIGLLIDQLEKYKRSAKNLSPKQIKQLNSALSKLYKEQRKNNPFKAISNMLDEAKERMATFDEDIKKTQEEIDNLTKKKKENIVEGIADEETDNKLKKAIKRLQELKKNQEEVGKPSASDWVASINETVSAVGAAVGVFDDLAKAIGGVNTSDVDKMFSILEKGGQGAAVGAQIGGGYGAIIGAVAGLATGIITTFADQWSGNAGITEQIQKSEMSIKRLENAYKRLDDAVNEAYGSATIGAKKAVISNKELQLAELQRQLQLEQSRKSKNKDEAKIEDLRGQIISLELDIKDATNDITNDLLGISSVGDAMETMMDAFIEALRSGEDAMSVFNKSVDDMIANMVKKMFTTKILQPWFDEQWGKIQQQIDERGKKGEEEIKKIQEQMALSDSQIVEQLRKGEITDFEGFYNTTITQSTLEEYRKYLEKKLAEAQKNLVQDTLPTTDDIIKYAELLRSGQPIIEENMSAIRDFLMQLGLMNDTSDKNLSALQQGIQGITEDTAGALEAYMNGVSQQVYLQSDLLTQIRDAVVGFNLDVQVATMSQILLQLQSSYTVQMSIQGILEGTLNPSGQGFRVELIS